MKTGVFLKHLFSLSAAALLALSLNACSLGIFGDGKDKKIQETTQYRKINPSCSQVDLSGSELNTKTFRDLLTCLNANGALDPLKRLVDRLNDRQLSPVVESVNRHILKNPKLLYQLEVSHQMMAKRGILKNTFFQLGRLLENERFVTSAIALLKEGFFSAPDRASKLRQPDRQLLRALERLSQEVTPKNSVRLLDASLTLASSQAFAQLSERFKGPSPSHRSLRDITDHLLAHLQDNDPTHVQVIKDLLARVQDGSLFMAIDLLLGSDTGSLRAGIPRLSAVLYALLQNNAELFDGTTSLFYYANQPMSCMNDGLLIENPALFIIEELLQNKADPAGFIKRDNPVTLASLNSFCQFKPEIGRYYGAFSKIADTTAIMPTVEMIDVFHQIQTPTGHKPLLDLLVRLLADKGVKHLIPLLSELTDRNLWDETLLLATLLKPEYRNTLISALNFLTEATESLNGASIFDAFSDVLLRTSPKHLYQFAKSMEAFTQLEQPLLLPSLRSLRQGFYSNDVHPLIELVQSVLKEAPKNAELFSTLFDLSEMAEFEATLRMTSQMAKDGRLIELFDALFTLFHGYAAAGAMKIEPTQEPAFVPELRHNFSTWDLLSFDIHPVDSGAANACAQIDLNIELGNTLDPAFEKQLHNVLACINSDGKHSDVVEALELLQEIKTEDGRSLFTLQADLLRALQLTGAESRFLLDSFRVAFDDSRVGRLLDAARFWIRLPNLHKPLEPLLKLLVPVYEKARAETKKLQLFLATKVLARNDFPQLFAYVRRIYREATDPAYPSGRPQLVPYDREHIRREVIANECESDINPDVRVDQIIDDFENAVNNWELDPRTGQAKKSWTLHEITERLDPVFEKMIDPPQNQPDHTLLDSLLRFVRYFSLKPGEAPRQDAHFSPEYLRQWFHDRAVDYRPISYIYPGEKKPRVRLVNSIDRLELVLINSDMEIGINKQNYALYFTSQIGEAWGDEERSLWPKEIQAKYPYPKTPPTLKNAIDEVLKTHRKFLKLTGEPSLPRCEDATWVGANYSRLASVNNDWESLSQWLDLKETRRTLFNINQVVQSLVEDLPHTGKGGVKVLRNMFFEFAYSSPEKNRSPKKGWDNNLSASIRFVRMGLGRQPGRILIKHDPTDPSLNDFFNSLVDAASSTHTDALAELLVFQPEREMIWKAVGEAFRWIDTSTPEELRRIGESAFHLVAIGKQLEVARVVPKTITAVLQQHLDFLQDNLHLAEDLVRSKDLSQTLKLFYAENQRQDNLALVSKLSEVALAALEDTELGTSAVGIMRAIYSDASALNAWDEFLKRKDELVTHPDYLALEIESAIAPILDFFEEQPGASTASIAAAQRLRSFLVTELQQGSFDQILLAAKDNPVEFYRVLETFANRKNEINDFLALVRRTLPNQKR